MTDTMSSAQLQSSLQSSTRTLANTHLTHYPATPSTESTTYLLHQNSLYAPSVPHCAAKLPPKTMTATPASSRACLCSSPGQSRYPVQHLRRGHR
ncbi:hypothetical protein EJ06DRAFT_311052 [Trichodelitschia bisporula]|uniref:Uncharacterized protein n=1 Tax=Trichodelitschia bisporula TaxID=703511 RepID=A0A6G1I457_9PEZI|nr:hypothetical protein EJ06DRAFT_311052 [Trichodelitschia bisporula]